MLIIKYTLSSILSIIYIKILTIIFSLIPKKLFLLRIFISIMSSILLEKYILSKIIKNIPNLHKFILLNIKHILLITYFTSLISNPILYLLCIIYMIYLYFFNQKSSVILIYICLFIIQILIGFKYITNIAIQDISLIYPIISIFHFQFMRLYNIYILNNNNHK